MLTVCPEVFADFKSGKMTILANEFDASSYCKVLNDSILYLLQVCPDIWKPVCSSEEITYGNICKLKKVNIRFTSCFHCLVTIITIKID